MPLREKTLWRCVVADGDGGEGAEEQQLPGGQRADHGERDGAPGQHDCGEGHRDRDLEHGAVGAHAGQHDGQGVVDDRRGGVDQVEQVAADPRPSLHQPGPPPGRRGDEPVQATGGGDLRE